MLMMPEAQGLMPNRQLHAQSCPGVPACLLCLCLPLCLLDICTLPPHRPLCSKSLTTSYLTPSLQDSDLAVGPKLPQGWPRSGAIVFDQVVMKYAPHLPPALKGVSFDIKSSEKVGVVGRTGSGKSTLLLALYRMFNLESGSVTLDGLDISTITLNQLRNGLSVIPQEPVVFSGTVRSNLDPFGEKSHDGELWQALRECGLEEQVGRAHA
jgi:ATP-binding cassette subfamily C (CFTR/MRP) protein 1